MDENGLLEPSFADAIAAIEQRSELSPSRRTIGSVRYAKSPRRLGGPLRASRPAGVR
jgi:hypothetical protein